MMTSGLALMLQGSGFSLPANNDTLILAFLCVLVVAVLMQAFILLAMALGAHKTQKKVVELLEDLDGKLNPILDSTRSLLDDTGPKVRVITSNVLEASHLLRKQAENIHATVDEVTTRARKRIVMLDEMVGAGMITLDRAVAALQEGILAPMRQLNGLLSGLRTGLDVLRNKGRKAHTREDEDMFV